jgi:hypothetical protein
MCAFSFCFHWLFLRFLTVGPTDFEDQADTDPFNFDNIAKQRNLNEKGKELAKVLEASMYPALVGGGQE